MADRAPSRSRRQRYRDQTLDEVRMHAMRQLAEGGPGAVSLNAIAKAMGMTGPALYRYVDSRDALLTDLVVVAYEGLATTFGRAADGTPEDPPEARFLALAAAFRAWALEAPERYLLTFGGSTGSGGMDPERIVPPVQLAMAHVQHALTTLVGALDAAARTAVESAAVAQADTWAAAHGPTTGDPLVERLALLTWSRLHGVLSLDLGGHLAQTGVDPAVLYDAEVATLIAEVRGQAPAAR